VGAGRGGAAWRARGAGEVVRPLGLGEERRRAHREQLGQARASGGKRRKGGGRKREKKKGKTLEKRKRKEGEGREKKERGGAGFAPRSWRRSAMRGAGRALVDRRDARDEAHSEM